MRLPRIPRPRWLRLAAAVPALREAIFWCSVWPLARSSTQCFRLARQRIRANRGTCSRSSILPGRLTGDGWPVPARTARCDCGVPPIGGRDESHLRCQTVTTLNSCPVAFLDNNTIVTPRPARGVAGRWRVTFYDAATGDEVSTAGEDHPCELAAISKDETSDRWATADRDGTLRVWQGMRQPRLLALQKANSAVSSISISNDLLAAGLYSDAGGEGIVSVMTSTELLPLEEAVVSRHSHVLCCAIGADRRWLATSNADANEMLVFALPRDAAKQDGPPMLRSALRLPGGGPAPSRVAFAQGARKYVLGVSRSPSSAEEPEARGSIGEAFDLVECAWFLRRASPVVVATGSFRSFALAIAYRGIACGGRSEASDSGCHGQGRRGAGVTTLDQCAVAAQQVGHTLHVLDPRCPGQVRGLPTVQSGEIERGGARASGSAAADRWLSCSSTIGS